MKEFYIDPTLYTGRPANVSGRLPREIRTYDLLDQLIAEAAVSKQKFSADPRPLDPHVPSSFLQNIIFNHFMYSKQEEYEQQLEKLGLLNKDAFTCTCYMDEVGNVPKQGECCHGRSPRRWSMPIPFWGRVATAIPASSI